MNGHHSLQHYLELPASSSAGDFGKDFMSPLPPQLKGTFVDKLPSWSETSKDVNPPDTYLNVNIGKYLFNISILKCASVKLN